ncbi:broad-complex core protein isoforms 1/2/3/4/5-like isoform X2 [Cimex lectularius]|uniref:Uncharacterized protein n=1 Tax=Cimex lectularius TaxID=79782 RepID=A0A8I6SRF2_CIMLE|nr:broad-complex core protein isoforms 1/2/3/4/5-like isoform X2 [Cimex lectularius]
MSDGQQQFCLRWHNYQSSLLSSLPQLLDWDDLTDVTLYAGGSSIKAHRIVLSACSHYFKSIFKELQPMQHPVIVVPGADFSDLSALITFMYNGEVNIYQHQLQSLIALADTLHIKGLAHFTQVGGEPPEDNGWFTSNKRPRSEEPTNPVNNNNVTNSVFNLSSMSNGSLIGPSPTKNMYIRKAKGPRRTSPGVQPVPTGPEDLSKKQEDSPSPPSNSSCFQQAKEGGGGKSLSKLYVTCQICGKHLSNQYNLRVHMETHLNAHYACSSCSHVSRSRDALRKHVSYRHPPPQPQQVTTPPSSEEITSPSNSELPQLQQISSQQSSQLY